MDELELKLRLDAAACRHWRVALRGQGAQRLRLQALYFDTDDGRLRQAGVSLRLRREGRRWVQTVKSPADGTLRRREHEVERADVAPAGGAPAFPVLALHDGTEAGDALRRALDGRGAADLRLRHQTDVIRLALAVRTNHGSDLELALDIGTAVAAGTRQPITELEVEHLGGPLDGLFVVAGDVLAHGGAWISTCSKAQRGERLAAGTAALPVKARGLRLPKRADAAESLRLVLSNAHDHVLPNASEVAEGCDDAEVVLQLRVGLRRLRTALRLLAPLDPRLPTGLEAPLAEAFGLLGQRRDGETVAAAVEPLLEAAGAPKLTWSASPLPDTAGAVKAVPFQSALLALLAAAHAKSHDDGSLPRAQWVAQVAARLGRLHAQVLRDGRRFDRLDVERQHWVRKRLKRLRYLAEFVGSLWSAKRAARYVRGLEPAQEALGTHNDIAMAADRFALDAATDPRSLFAVGFLRSRLDVTQPDARKALRRLDACRPFWAERA